MKLCFQNKANWLAKVSFRSLSFPNLTFAMAIFNARASPVAHTNHAATTYSICARLLEKEKLYKNERHQWRKFKIKSIPSHFSTPKVHTFISSALVFILHTMYFKWNIPSKFNFKVCCN